MVRFTCIFYLKSGQFYNSKYGVYTDCYTFVCEDDECSYSQKNENEWQGLTHHKVKWEVDVVGSEKFGRRYWCRK